MGEGCGYVIALLAVIVAIVLIVTSCDIRHAGGQLRDTSPPASVNSVAEPAD